MCSCVCSVEVSGMTNQLSFSEFRLFADLEFGVKRRRCDSLPKQVVLIELNYEIKIERNIINHKLFFTLALAFQQKNNDDDDDNGEPRFFRPIDELAGLFFFISLAEKLVCVIARRKKYANVVSRRRKIAKTRFFSSIKYASEDQI